MRIVARGIYYGGRDGLGGKRLGEWRIRGKQDVGTAAETTALGRYGGVLLT